MIVPTASNAPTPPVANPAGLGKVWPNPAILHTGRFPTGSLGVWQYINGASGLSERPRPTPNSA